MERPNLIYNPAIENQTQLRSAFLSKISFSKVLGSQPSCTISNKDNENKISLEQVNIKNENEQPGKAENVGKKIDSSVSTKSSLACSDSPPRFLPHSTPKLAETPQTSQQILKATIVPIFKPKRVPVSINAITAETRTETPKSSANVSSSSDVVNKTKHILSGIMFRSLCSKTQSTGENNTINQQVPVKRKTTPTHSSSSQEQKAAESSDHVSIYR